MPPETTTNEQAHTSEGDGKNSADSTGTQTGATATGTATTSTTPAATAKPQTTDGKTFTQEDIDRIVTTRLNAQRAQFDKQKADEKLAADGEWQKLAQSHEAENAQLKADLAKKDRDLLATRIAAKHQLPETLAARLMGEDADALEADAAALAKLIEKPAAPPPIPPSSGSPANGQRPNNGAPIKREDLESMDWRQIAKLKDEGKLDHLLSGQPR